MNVARLSEMKMLYFALPPLLVYILALAILEFGGLGFPEANPFPSLLIDASGSASASLGMNHARVNWMSSVLMFGALACAVLAASLVIMHGALSKREFRIFLMVGAGLAVGGIIQLLISSRPGSSVGLIFRITHSVMQASGRFDDDDLKSIKDLVGLVNILAATVPAFVILAGCSLLAMPSNRLVADPRPFLRRRMSQLKTITDLGSALLVTGALHLLLWLRWPIVFTHDVTLQKAIGEWALSMTLYCGTAYSLMIAAFFIPCSWALARNAERLLRQALPECSETELHDWLDKYGFSVAPIRQLPQVIATLAPMLAGPIGSAITGLGGATG